MIKFKQRELTRINKKFKNDCVIQAIATVVEQKYCVIFNDLMDLGKELGGYPNCDFVWQPYIESVVNGYCIDTWDCTYRPVNSYWS